MQRTRYSCHILMKHESSRQIFENTGILNFMKIRQVGAELFHTKGRTGRHKHMTKLTVAFRNLPMRLITIYESNKISDRAVQNELGRLMN
jgi:hypothetical protein